MEKEIALFVEEKKNWRREIYFLRKRSKMENEMKRNILRRKIFFLWRSRRTEKGAGGAPLRY